MELRVLKYFLMAAREENITRASQLLHVTQPTLSRQLMQLEEELGVKLFHRSNHRIILTQDGMLLRRRAQEIVELTEKTEREFIHDDRELTGEISIGSGETRSVTLFAKMLASFGEMYPGVHYQVVSANADHIKERIENGTLDLGLLTEPVDISRYEFARMPVLEEWGVLVREDSPIAKLDIVTPADLLGRPLMVPGRALVQNELENWFGSSYDKMDVRVRFNLVYNVAMMVHEGIAEAVCIRLNTSYNGLRFVPLSPSLQMGSVLVWKKNQVFSQAMSAFTEHIKKCVKSISENVN